jgi:predicted nucleic acid-binding protein
MKRLRIYLDTSVISHLDSPDVPDRQEDTHKLWEDIRAGSYEAFISPVVIQELSDCLEPKRSVLARQLRLIPHTILQEVDEVLNLATKYLETGILREKSFDDCQHIAYASVYNCDMVVSWNFKHMVNYKTITGVKGANALSGYRGMPICSPTMLIGGADGDT